MIPKLICDSPFLFGLDPRGLRVVEFVLPEPGLFTLDNTANNLSARRVDAFFSTCSKVSADEISFRSPTLHSKFS